MLIFSLLSEKILSSVFNCTFHVFCCTLCKLGKVHTSIDPFNSKKYRYIDSDTLDNIILSLFSCLFIHILTYTLYIYIYIYIYIILSPIFCAHIPFGYLDDRVSSFLLQRKLSCAEMSCLLSGQERERERETDKGLTCCYFWYNNKLDVNIVSWVDGVQDYILDILVYNTHHVHISWIWYICTIVRMCR